MRRLIAPAAMITLALTLAPAVVGGAPLHERETSSVTFDFAAGELCDFAYHQTTVNKANTFVFGDPENPSRVVFQLQSRVVHTNVATGYTLTETIGNVETFYPGTQVDKLVGMFWHLRDAHGRLVAVHAGQMTFDYSGDVPVEIIVTPKADPDFAGVICPALGGHPA